MTLQRFIAIDRAVTAYIEAQTEAMTKALGQNKLAEYHEHAIEAQHASAGMAVLKERFPKQASQLEGAAS